MANSEYKPITVQLVNRGVSLKQDPGALQAGQFVELDNVVSIQEGSIASRFGSTRFSGAIPDSFPHTIGLLRASSADADQYFYVGTGADIYRIQKSTPSVVTQMSNVSLPAWGQRWTSATHRAGSSGKAWFLVAASKMLKDDLSSTTFQRWGILPPPNSASATIGGAFSTTIDGGDSPAHTWAGGETTSYQPVVVRSTAISLAAFTTPSALASGDAYNNYDSDDIIEITFTLSNYDSFTGYTVQLDSVVGGAYTNAYYKSLKPWQSTAIVPSDPNNIDSVRNTPYMLPQSTGGANQQITVRVRKNEFARQGTAGTGSTNWSTIKGVRLLVLCKDTGATFTVNSVKLLGGKGPDNSSGTGALPYSYCYTYRNDNTGHESNPSIPMIDAVQVRNVQRQAVSVWNVAYSTDTQVTSIAVYRAGGSYADGMFRLLGRVANNTGGGATTYSDTLTDLDIVNSPTLEFDNDPPVFSTLPTALSASFTGTNSTSGSQNITLNGNVSGVLTPGSNLTVLDGSKTETIRVAAVVSSNVISTYFQYAHTGTVSATCEAVCGAACRMCVAAHDSIYLAGDNNNPHVLYKSKTGRPESFPVVTEASGVVNQVIVGSQSNPIMALTEENGEIICLNLRGIYLVRTFQGQMQSPIEAPCSHGLLTSAGWCRGDGAIYYLSNDGVYAWRGSSEEKISEDIDWFFRGVTINGRKPMKMDTDGLLWVRMEYFRNEIRLNCVNSDGTNLVAVYDTLYKRWRFESLKWEGGGGGLNTYNSTMLATNEALYTSRSVGGTSYLYQEFVGSVDNATPIKCAAQTGWYTFDTPSLEKQFGDILLEYTAPGDAILVKTYYDYSSTADETFTVPSSTNRTMVPLPIQTGFAKRAKAIAFRFEFNTTSSGPITIHSLTFNILPLAEVQRGRTSDWNDGGYPHDKRLDQAIFELDTKGSNVTFNLDTISGVIGSTYTEAVDSFLVNTTSTRSRVSFPIQDSNGKPVICKAWRIRPTTTSSDFNIFDSTVTFEKYPPDTTIFTEPSDYGTPFDKHFNELLLDIDTGNVACQVNIYVDGASSPNQTLTVTSTQATRQQNFTLKTGITGKKARLGLVPGTNGKAQLFSHNFVALPADKGEVRHSTDWDDLGHPFDKLLKELVLEYEVTQPVNMVVLGISGIGHAQTQSTITTFTLTTSGRKEVNIPMPDNTIVKLVSVQPATNYPDIQAKIYKADFQADKLPADITSYTDWMDFGWRGEKIVRALLLDIDTGGVACTVELQADGATVKTFTVTSAIGDRARNISCTSDVNNTYTIGKKFRLKLTPGNGGKAQLYSWDLERTLEPIAQSFWDSMEQHFGSAGWSYIKQLWLEFRSTGPITVDIYVDGGRLFYSKVLAAQDYRNAVRWYLPAVNSGVLNKSKSYRITITASSGVFHLYRDSTRVESMNLSAGARAAYLQHYLWDEMPLVR